MGRKKTNSEKRQTNQLKRGKAVPHACNKPTVPPSDDRQSYANIDFYRPWEWITNKQEMQCLHDPEYASYRHTVQEYWHHKNSPILGSAEPFVKSDPVDFRNVKVNVQFEKLENS